MCSEEPVRTPSGGTHVVSEVVLFGATVMHHVVDVQDHERDAMRLFGLKRRSGNERHQDRQNMRLFQISEKRSFDAHPFDDDAPSVEHASLTAFFEAVGYSFRRNEYARCERALAAFGIDPEALAA